MPQISFYLFGSPRLERDGLSVELNTRKAIALLAYLVLNEQPQRRETLTTLFWPDSEPARARAALRSTLWALNKALDDQWLMVEREEIGLANSPEFDVDVGRFQQLLTAAQLNQPVEPDDCRLTLDTLTAAVDLYQADFMAGFTLRDSAVFDEWQFYQTEQFRQQLAAALERIILCYNRLRTYEAAIPYAQRWITLDPLHEPAQRQLIALYLDTGQRSAALRQYEQCVRVLEEELGALPHAETLALYEQIRHSPTRPAQQPPSQVITEPVQAEATNRLPAPLTPFIGREAELAEINQRLADPTCRLLTLVGPGGIGKTRLAIQIAYDQAGRFPDGVHFISLAGVDTPEFLISTTVKTLRLSPDTPGQLKAQLLDYLRNKQMLLIMDNFEQLLDGAELLTEILSIVTNLKIVVTSRERLNVQGEWAFVVPGMQVPVGQSVFNGVEGYSAVQLFLQSANRTQPNFDWQDQDKPVIARICELVDGVPLGIELAAAWVRVLPLQEIAQEIERSLDFLTTSQRNVPERHRSLRAAFEHSWRLLSEKERAVYRQLSVFHGGFDRAAGDNVAGANLITLSSLVDKSLIYYKGSGRYELHQILKQYAQEKLQSDSADMEAAQSRHCHYFADLVERLYESVWDCEQKRRDPSRFGPARDTMHLEIDNIRAAWRYAVTQRQLPKIAQFIVGLPPFFEAQVWLQEGYAALKLASDHLRAALDDPNLNASDRHDIEAMLMMVLYRQSKFCSSLGSQAQAQALACESLTIAEKYDNWEQVASVRRILAKLAMYQGHSDEAKSQLKQALALYHQHNSYEHTLKILSMLAYIAADAGDYDEAEKWIEESLKRGRHLSQTNQHDRMKARDLLAGLPVETGLETSMLITPEAAKLPAELPLCTLGYVYFLMGKYQEARPILEEGLAEARAIGDQMYLTIALINMGYNSEALDEDEAAEMYFSEALVIARQAQSVPFALDILAGIGIRLVKGQEQARGLTILGLVFDHPASFQESKNRAAERLARLSLPLPAQQPGLWPADQSQILWQLVADWLAERQPVVSEV